MSDPDLLRIGVLLERANGHVMADEKFRALIALQEARSMLYEIAPPMLAEVIPFPTPES